MPGKCVGLGPTGARARTRALVVVSTAYPPVVADYHAVLGALQGMTIAQVQHRVTSTLWDTLKAQWAFWIPAQLINFKCEGLPCPLARFSAWRPRTAPSHVARHTLPDLPADCERPLWPLLSSAGRFPRRTCA